MKSDIILDKIREKLKESNQSNRTLTNIFLFHFNDNNGDLIKNVVMDFKNLTIYDGLDENADVELTITDEDFFLIGSKKITFTELLNNGKIKISGDQEALTKMIDKFRLNSEN